MEITKIPTENANIEQWRLLNQFAYPTNVKKYIFENSIPDNSVEEYVASCIRQSEAYFSTFEKSSLDISPLLLYYGATNLLVGVSTMLEGTRLNIKNHGMMLKFPIDENLDINNLSSKSFFANFRLSDIKILPINQSVGGLHWFCNSFSDGTKLVEKGGEWTLEEIFGSIPDLRLDFVSSYLGKQLFCVPVEITQRELIYREEKPKKHKVIFERIKKVDVSNYENFPEVLENVKGFSEAYLKPQYMDNAYYKDKMNHIILYRRIWADEVGFYSIFGQKYLELSHLKKGFSIAPGQIVILIMGLYALGCLSRYYPEIWNHFIRNDNTGEKLIVEKFLSLAHRYLPNLIINRIFNKRIEFIHITGSNTHITELQRN